MCISISIGHKTSGGSQIIYFNATDGTNNLYGDDAWGWGGNPAWTDEEYKALKIPYILSWFNKPETELCGYVPPCIPNWKIGEWGTCQPDNTQTRTVTDLNNCNDTTGKPATIQSCIYIPPCNLSVCDFIMT